MEHDVGMLGRNSTIVL